MSNTNETRILQFTDASGNKLAYSGLSGLILESNEYIRESISEPDKADPEIYSYLFDDPFLNVDFHFFHGEPDFDTLTVFTTNQCNLNCTYCFEKVSESNRATQMDINVFKDGIIYFLSNFKHNKVINIHFFGGEPLLNFSLIKEAVYFLKSVERENELQFNYTVTTNGTLLNENEIRGFLVSNNFSVMVSIDGNEETHDKNRFFYNGQGSYKIIAENIKELSKYINIMARVTVTSPEIDLISLYESLHDIGISEVTIELVSQNHDINLKTLSDSMKTFADYFISNLRNKKLVRYKNFIDVLCSIHFGNRKSPKYFPCSAGVSAYALSPNGDIYPCHRFVNFEQYRWGSIYSNFDNEQRKDFLSKNILFIRNDGKCSECWAKYLCGGTCYNTSHFMNGNTEDVSPMHCLFLQEIIKNALYIYASLNDNERAIFDSMS